MIDVEIPGYTRLQLEHLVLDYNGTLAVDGHCLPGVKERLRSLAEKLTVHVITADTFGLVQAEMQDVSCQVTIMPKGNQDAGKLDYVNRLGSQHTVSIGNGRNDRLMLEACALGIAVILKEGAAAQTLMAADAVFTDVVSALEFLEKPLRMTATLRF